MTKPSGKESQCEVTILNGTETVLTISLADGTATATLAPAQLNPGIYQPVAAYGGDQANGGSSSTSQRLTVLPTPTAP